MSDPKVNVIVGASTASAQRAIGILTTAVGNMIARWQDYALMAARSIANQTQAAIEFADQINKLSQKTGIAHRELSAMVYVAGLADVSISELEISIRQLNQWMERTGKTTSSTMDVLLESADEFAAMADGPAKTAIAMERFGRAGTQMIPLLNQGREGIKQMIGEAEKLGLIIDAKTARAAEAFNDNLRRLHEAGRGVFLQLAERLLPALNELTETFVALAKNKDLLEPFFAVAVEGMRQLAESAKYTVVAVAGFQGAVEAWALGKITGLPIDPLKALDASMSHTLARLNDGRKESSGTGSPPSGHAYGDRATDAERLQQELARLKLQERIFASAKDHLDILRDQLGVAQELDALALAEAGRIGVEAEGSKQALEAQERTLRTFAEVLDIKERMRSVETEMDRGNLGVQLGEQWSGMLQRLGTDAQIAAAGIRGAFEGAFSSISTGLVNIIEQTGTWNDLLRSVRHVILQEIITAIVQMFMRWIAMETMKAMVSIGLARQETAAEMPHALAKSISSYGLAALIGGAAFFAMTAALGGFRSGGYTGDGSDDEVAGVVHSGEYVMPAPAVRQIGLPTLESLRTGSLTAGDMAFSPRSYAVPSGGAGVAREAAQRVNVVLVDSRRAAERWMEENGDARIIEVLNRS